MRRAFVALTLVLVTVLGLAAPAQAAPVIRLWNPGFFFPGDFVMQGVTVSAPGVPVAIGYGDECATGSGSYAAGHTDERGDFRMTFPAGRDYTGEFCAWLTDGDPAARLGEVRGHVGYYYVLQAAPARRVVLAATDVAVAGVLQPFQSGKEVLLQRLYRDGQWRTVNQGRTDTTAGFSVVATPPTSGTHRYRVVAAEEPHRATNHSPEFTIRSVEA
ncbi:hypothetical protein AB0M54_39765 [Actinoplanes sp. NPDC051470]|uniref:hypothetical protein n=1 Tax=unclassified Actinoplanes TaxID=2626549 RepID=UPI00342BAEC4